jgi:phenylacetate-CoA ligase
MSFDLIYHLLKLFKNQWLTHEELEQLQQRKLQKIIKHAYERVSYYHRLFNSLGIRPGDIKSGKHLRYIPITSREQIQSLPINEIVARGVKLSNYCRVRTSGSTGMPLEVIKSKKETELSSLVIWRSFLANGCRLTDKRVMVTVPRNPHKYWFQYLGIMRKNCISAFDSPEDQIKQARQFKPDFIWGYPSSLRRIAEEIKKRDIEDISPRGIVTGGEHLDQTTRQIIQSAFPSKVVDFYSSEEFGNIAWECDHHEGYHINIDSLVVEIVNNGKSARSGEKGEVIITSLDSYAMPLIRYAIGDIAISGEGLCSCGRGLPLLKSIEGRADDLVVFSNGTVVSFSELVYVLRAIPGVLQFRVIQKKIDNFLVQVKIKRSFTQETVIKKVRQEMTRILRPQSSFEIQTLDEIPKDPSGKTRSVISYIKPRLSKKV